MKWRPAGQRFASEEAVSSIVAVLLMVGVTVVLGGTVYLLTSPSDPQPRAAQNLAGSARSSNPNSFTLTLTHSESLASVPMANVLVLLDGTGCDIGPGRPGMLEDADADGEWDVGESIRFVSDCQPVPAPLGSGSTHAVTAYVGGVQLAADNTVYIR